MTSWAPSVNGRIRTITASPDGSRIYIGGSFTSVDGAARWRIAAFRTSDGSLDTSFNPIAGSDVFGIAATDTKVYLGGWFTAVNNVPRTRLAAVSAADGSVLDWAPTADHTVYALGVTPAQDRVVVSGSFTTLNGSLNRSIGSLDAVTGASYPFAASQRIDNTTDASGLMSLKVFGNQVMSTGFAYGDGDLEGIVVADAYDGTIQNLIDCHGDTYDAAPLNGVVYSVSHHHMCSNSGGFPEINPRRYYAADGWTIAPQGTVNRNTQTGGHYVNFEGMPTGAQVHWVNDWVPGTYTGVDQAGWTTETSGDYLAIGGEFLAVNGVQQQGLVRFATRNVVTQPSAGPSGLRAETAPVLQSATTSVQGSYLTSWDRDGATLSYKVVRTDKGEANPVATATSPSNPWTRPTLRFSDADVIPGWTYSYYVIATDADGNSKTSDTTTITVSTVSDPYASVVATDGAEHYWRMGQASGIRTTQDVAGSRPLTLGTGTTGGRAGALAGNADTATQFSGTSTGTAGTAGAALPPQQVFTTELWFKTTSLSGGKLMGWGSSATGSSGANDRNLYMNNAGRLTFGVYDGSIKSITSPGTYRDGAWHYAVASLSPGGVKLYVDGQLVASNTSATRAEDIPGYWRVGGDKMPNWPNAGTSAYFNGAIDEVAVYPTELTAAQVQAHYAAASAALTNQQPTAAFTANPTDLTVAFDSTGSVDADGSIAAYGWEFGDGGRATGPTASHDYGAPGTYTVKLTVVDNQGAVKTLSKAVSVATDPSTQVIARDTFNRAGSRWGTASVGGAWTDSGSAYFSTNGTQGVVNLSKAASGPSASLGNVSARDITMLTDVALDKVPAGGVYLHQLQARLSGGNSYKLVTRFETNGSVRVTLSKKVGATETALKWVWATGITYTPGQRLNLRFDVHGTNASVLEAKVWAAGSPEPLAPTVRVTDDQPELQGAGAVGMMPYTSGAMTSLPLAVTVDNFQVNAFVDTNAAPAADFAVTQEGLAIATDSAASSDSDGSIQSWAWNFGDGATASGPTASHTYAAGGTYIVTLSVTDDDGATSSYSRELTVVKPNALPVAAIANPAVDELTVTLDGRGSTDADGAVASHAWDFGDGTESVDPVATHTYAAAGTYTVTLTVTDEHGAVGQATREVTVSPNVAPVASFTAAKQGLALAVDGSASSDADGSVASYAWDFGDGQTDAGATAQHAYAAAGSYTVMLTVTDNKGATATTTRAVTVDAIAPDVVALDSFDRTAAGWGTAEVGGAWTLNTPTGFATRGTTGQVAVPAGATRLARLTGVSAKDVSIVTDVALEKAPAGGAFLHQVQARVVGNSYYTLTTRVDASGALKVLLSRTVAGVETTLKSTTLSGFTYAAGDKLSVRFDVVGTSLVGSVWREGTAEPATPMIAVTDGTATLQSPGNVALRWYAGSSVTNAPIVAATDLITVRRVEVPNQAPAASFTTSAQNLAVSVDGASSADADGTIVSHAWSFGDGAMATGATASHTYAASGTYTVTLTVTDDRGATADSAKQVTVSVPAPNQPPTAAITAGVLDLTASVNGTGSSDPDGSIASYAWTFGDGATATGPTASHTYAAAGTYTVRLTVTDDRGATATTTEQVAVTAPAVQALAQDNFTRTASGWGSADVGGAWMLNTSTGFSTDGAAGRVLVPSGATRLARLTGVSARDVSVVTDLALNKAPNVGPYYHRIQTRINGTSDYTLTARFEASGALRLYVSRTVNGVETVLATTVLNGFNYVAGEKLNVRFDAVDTTLSGWVWRATDAVPTASTVTVSDTTPELQVAGNVAVKLYTGSTVTNGPLTASLDQFTVLPA
nr:PKD domain-containing protein [Propioniciclava soli]